MTIRKAEIADLQRLAGCAEAFYASSKFLKRFELERFVNAWTGLITSGTGVIFLLERDGEIAGTIGGVVYPDLYSGDLIASEFFWYVLDTQRGGGLRLLYQFEDWAKEQGCTQVRMVHLLDSMPEKLSKVYKRLGYIEAERHYTKELAK